MNLLCAVLAIGFTALTWSICRMSKALEDAIARLTTEVNETLTDVAEALRKAAEATDDTAAADAIGAQADRLDAFQATLTPAPAPEPPAA